MNVLPHVVGSERLADKRLCLTLAIEPDAAVFEGHFPDHPILPGVAQIDWAARLADHHFEGIGVFAGMEKIKFHQIIQPPAQVRLCLEWQAQAGRLLFDYRAHNADRVYSSGCLRFAF